jgi:hypothetical protein
MLSREDRQGTEQRPEPSRTALGLCPRLRADLQLASAAAEHRIAENKRSLTRQPQGDLIDSLDTEDPKLVK